ncbi:MAG: Gfo/Idh/MocA family oxidoreductase [Bacteroidales bacterium]|nr:Gfo/Idh/MocA family oxidoreductase [Bacteroidales bacterium]
MKNSRRRFIKNLAIGTAGIVVPSVTFSAKSYKRIIGSNDRIRAGIIGFSDRARQTLIPAFLSQAPLVNMEIVAVSDIWNRRRAEADEYFRRKGIPVKLARNNEELYDWNITDGVIISTADFQHALHTIEAVKAGCDVYVEKPFAETMDDNRSALKTIRASEKIVQIGSQRRSGANYIKAAAYIKSGDFGPITMVEMCWNVNQPGRWRRPDLVNNIKETDTDWKRYLLNRPYEPWDPRKYIEYRLFWPYSSGIPGQWMCHQIDTIHWFTGLNHPRSVVANGGIYVWKDGRSNDDTMTAVFDYGPSEDPGSGFQVVYSSRMHNSSGGIKELYFSNGGTLNLDTNKVTSEGGLTENHAKTMGMKANLLKELELPETVVETAANTGADDMTVAHMRNWMDCMRSRKIPNADEMAGFNHSVAVILTNAALRTGEKVTYNEELQEVMAAGKVFKY